VTDGIADIDSPPFGTDYFELVESITQRSPAIFGTAAQSAGLRH
jgi:hypothetical protein